MASRSDNFNRADGAIGTPSDGGSPWIIFDGIWEVQSNQAVLNMLAGADCALESSASDVLVGATFIQGTQWGLMVRAVDIDNFLFFSNSVVLSPPFPTVFSLGKLEANVTEILASINSITDPTVTAQSGDVFQIRAQGPLLELYKNGTLYLQATTTFNQNATKHGFTSLGGNAIWDDFSITEATLFFVEAVDVANAGAVAVEVSGG